MTNEKTPTILTGLLESLGPDCLDRIQNCRLLVVGAGGIGCELLKNLSLSGFRHVEVVDLDTIDVSNLNRQLLFRAKHVGQPKCVVGVAVAKDLSPYADTQMTARHGNVCDNSVFNVQYMEQFDLVLNALDNVTARRRVNRLCLAANVPMMEAGTTGYLGQVQTIYKGVACYECKTQEPPKVYPICTIRSTPSQPVHTIVWAKELYKLLLSPDPSQSMLWEDSQNEELSTYMEAALELRDNNQDPDASEDTKKTTIDRLWKALYADEIQKQLNMDRYKTAEKTPIVLEMPTAAANTQSEWKPMSIWSLTECVYEFRNALMSALEMPEFFDKDDELAMRFVTAAAQLRSMNFHIPLQSYHDTKGIAGNIIPAIATTNAIVAGLQILQVFSLLQAQLANKDNSSKLPPVGTGKYINCLRNATRNGLYLAASPLETPNPQCFVCREQVTVVLTLPTKALQVISFARFVQTIIQQELGFAEPTVYLNQDVLIWEEGNDSDEALRRVNGVKLLQDLPRGGLQHGSVLTVEDFSQDLQVDVRVVVVSDEDFRRQYGKEDDAEEDDDADGFRYHIGGDKPVVGSSAGEDDEAKESSVDNKAAASAVVEDGDDDGVVEIVEDTSDGNKRAMNGATGHESPLKKQKPSEGASTEGGEEVIEIDD
ncbi:ubiquitin-like 1-activating enzyme E1 B [Fistulifera solaris]|uniref:SUMO-activating enzyme subunit n=1 Tax=Fistulifera solaris TaxID=1519565 RepID=A0A1Z5JEM0_FISSO|nr:ubiquitin-like 1-activating enzyme E1 B [Fistulifera solaris]|eukprot:GAX12455.1 ubiquitin-like 1-activating enzyme E1 B [Fistulifera solaris]